MCCQSVPPSRPRGQMRDELDRLCSPQRRATQWQGVFRRLLEANPCSPRWVHAQFGLPEGPFTELESGRNGYAMTRSSFVGSAVGGGMLGAAVNPDAVAVGLKLSRSIASVCESDGDGITNWSVCIREGANVPGPLDAATVGTPRGSPVAAGGPAAGRGMATAIGGRGGAATGRVSRRSSSGPCRSSVEEFGFSSVRSTQLVDWDRETETKRPDTPWGFGIGSVGRARGRGKRKRLYESSAYT